MRPPTHLATELEALRAALAEAETRAEDGRNALLRAVAEADNARKRAQRDVEAAQPVRGGAPGGRPARRAPTASSSVSPPAPGADAARLVEGMEATRRLLAKAFERAGMSVVDPQGQPFNPELHEAMTTQPSAESAPGTVLAVVQKGYTLNGRLLRPARVVVARAPDPAN